MKTASMLTIIAVSICLMMLPAMGVGQAKPISPELEQQVKNLIRAHDSCWEKEDLDGFMNLLDEDFRIVFSGAGKKELKEVLQKLSEGIDYTKVESTITSIERKDDFILVRTSEQSIYRKSSTKEEEEKTSNMAFFLQQRGDRLLIKLLSRDIEEGTFDPASRIYQSKKGKYAIQIPEKWMPLGCPFGLEQMTPDAVIALAPDYESCVLLGFVQLPIAVGPEQAVKADDAAMQRLAEAYTLHEQGEMKVGELPGYMIAAEFKLESQHRMRERVYFSHDPFLYFFICDAIPPEKYDGLKQTFATIVQSFKTTAPEEGSSLKEEVMAEFAQGSIAGQVYTSKEYNCFIAAPEGWELATSANPMHLVQMNYSKGKSLVRLIGAKGEMAPPIELQKAVEERVKGLKKLLKQCEEHSRRNLTVAGVPAVESVLSYYIDEVGQMKVKEVSLVKDGVFYLILCQALEPDSYEALEKDFDQIVASFGFIK